MKKLTEKENFMMFMRGEQPEWVPRYGMGIADPYSEHPPAVAGVPPGFMNERRTPDGGFDAWGGGFCFWSNTYGRTGDKATEDRRRWLTEEYDSYGRAYYSRGR